MNKLKIRQYWSSFGKPWYIIRYGKKACDYTIAQTYNLNEGIAQGIERGIRLLEWDSEPLVYQ